MSDQEAKPTVQQVSVKLRDAQGSEIEFKVKGSTKFSKIAATYATKKGINPDSIKFVLNGETLNKDSEKSVTDHGIEDGDVIDVETAQVGGC
ncbi:hypothetical protein H9P43_008690 [Blastocladiella emersonii ATCC 22665]|nr:hypothetical protein H9P43_008690 [Blastocladiella emersonii ATCC 22665]